MVAGGGSWVTVATSLVLWPLARLLDGPLRLDRAAALNLALQALLGTALYNAGLLAGLRA